LNYYERYCGDYARDTAHLSLAEHGAYTLLLDAYYSMERPFVADCGPLFRICRAMNKAEQECVRRVVDEFFPVNGDGQRHNSRADRDIEKALKRINSARDNGWKGGRPRKNPTGTQLEPSGLSNVNPVGSNPVIKNITQTEPTGNPPETQPGEALPDPTRHNPFPGKAPEKKNPGKGVRRKPPETPLPADFSISDRVRNWAESKGYNRLDEHLEAFIGLARAKGYTYADWDAAFENAIRGDWGKVREGGPPKRGPSKHVAL
jgi:uncharacterized protein YdaU (DUF1376 family)